MIIYIALPQQVWSNECLWIRPEGFDWIWSQPFPCTCSSSHEDFPFFPPLPFWKPDCIYKNWSHFQSFMSTNKIKFDKSSVGCLRWTKCFFCKIIKEYEGKTRILGIKTILCRTHKNAFSPLPTRSNWLGGFVSVTKLFSSSFCSSALHSPSFISTLPSCLHDQYWTIFGKLFCSSWSHEPYFFFQCTAVCFFSGTDALTRLFARGAWVS